MSVFIEVLEKQRARNRERKREGFQTASLWGNTPLPEIAWHTFVLFALCFVVADRLIGRAHPWITALVAMQLFHYADRLILKELYKDCKPI